MSNPTEAPWTETTFRDGLIDHLENTCTDDLISNVQTSTEAGIHSGVTGLVVTMSDGSKFMLTVKQL